MNKDDALTIRVILAIVGLVLLTTVVAGFLIDFLPVPFGLLAVFAVGAWLCWWPTNSEWSPGDLRPAWSQPQIRPDDYEPMPGTLTFQGAPVPAGSVVHLHRVPWYQAEVPPARHECWPQTIVRVQGYLEERVCACGARRAGDGVWSERNSRRADA